MAGYIGTTPVPQATQHRESFTATGGQTSFATAGYTPQFIDVYLNGVKLAPADYTATNGSDVVLASGATASDILEIVAYTPFEVANQTFTGDTSVTNLAVTGTFTSRGIDDNADAVAITIDSSENVGIGTTSPDKLVHLKTSVNNTAVLQIESTATDSYPFLSLKNDAREYQLAAHGPLGDVFTIYDGTAGSHRFVIDSSGSVGIGTSSPFNVNGKNLHVQASSSNARAILESSGGSGRNWTMQSATDGSLNFYDLTGSSEAMRIDSSGNLLVGKTSIGLSTTGIDLRSTGLLQAIRDGGTVVELNRQTSDGTIIDLRKDNTTVGSIGTTASDLYIGTGDTTIRFADGVDGVIPTGTNGAQRDGAVNLGAASNRFQHLYLSGGVFLGGTGSANKLDDYEEGTYEVTIGTSVSGTVTLNSSWDDASYTKVGNVVHVQGALDVSSSSSPTGYFKISLPFTVLNVSPNQAYRSVGTVNIYNVASANSADFTTLLVQGESSLRVYLGDATDLQGDSAQQLNNGSNPRIAFQVTYRTT